MEKKREKMKKNGKIGENRKEIKILINGVERKVVEGTNLEQFLKELQVLEKTMAVAVNTQIVKREKWKTEILKDGDRIEALQFVGGG